MLNNLHAADQKMTEFWETVPVIIPHNSDLEITETQEKWKKFRT